MNDLQGEEVSSSIKHQYVFNSSSLLANLPKNKGCAGLLPGRRVGQSSKLKYNGTGLLLFSSAVF